VLCFRNALKKGKLWPKEGGDLIKEFVLSLSVFVGGGEIRGKNIGRLSPAFRRGERPKENS